MDHLSAFFAREFFDMARERLYTDAYLPPDIRRIDADTDAELDVTRELPAVTL